MSAVESSEMVCQTKGVIELPMKLKAGLKL